jgi:hypothetical protein
MRKLWLSVIGIVGLALPLTAFGQNLANGNFATGDLTGWTAETINGGQVSAVKQGTTFSTHPGSNLIPFPDGPGSYAADLRAPTAGPPQSVGILTSAPFVPRSEKLYFLTLSESDAVAPQALVLTSSANTLNPSLSDILLLKDVVHDQPGTGSTAKFQSQELDVSSEFAAKQVIRLQFRQPATANGAGFFTLIADVADLPPDTVPPDAITDLTVSKTSSSSVTLSFTAPKDTGSGTTGSAASYQIRYSLSPITDDNFSAATAFNAAPKPSAAGTKESIEVTGLDTVQTYYFALKSLDAAKNSSALSNVVQGMTSSTQLGRATGTILDATGAPAVGFSVNVKPDSGNVSVVVTDDAGAYTVLLPPGTYHISGMNLNSKIPSSTPPITITAGTMTTVPPITLGPLEVRGLGIFNGNFATGDFTGWTPTGYDGGLVQIEQNGKQYFGDPVPYPDGDDSYAVDVRSWDDPLHLGDTASTGILVSDPFIPYAATLTFWTHSQSKPVAATLLLLKLTADPIQPKPEDILLQVDVRNDNPGQGSSFSFEKQVVDISPFFNAADPAKGTPMRLEVRQHTLEAYSGWYTLFTDFDAGPVANLTSDTVPPNAITDLTVTKTSPSSVTLSFTVPKDTGIGSSGSVESYEVRYSLSPITEANFWAALRFATPPKPLLPGALQTVEVTGLDEVQAYYFAVKSLDAAKLASPISNVVHAATSSPPPPGRVNGIVMDSTGAPAAAFTLRFTSDGGEVTNVTTNADGGYTLFLPSGTYHVSGGTLTSQVPSSTPPVIVTSGAVTTVPPITLGPLEPRGLGIFNGNFATGDLTGWTPTGYHGGLVQIEQNGKQYFGDPVPYPDGDDSYAVDVRSWGAPDDITSTGILVSDPFIPNAPTLSFWTHSQNKPVAATLLLLKPTADPIQPKPEDILLQVNVRNDTPGMGSGFSFEKQLVDISAFFNVSDPTKGTPMRLEVRQHTLEAYSGWYTLFTDFDAGPVAVNVSQRAKGDLNGDTHLGVGDAVVALQIVVKVLDASPELVKVGDVAPKNPDGSYGDGVITISDVIRILRRTVGLEPDPWP